MEENKTKEKVEKKRNIAVRYIVVSLTLLVVAVILLIAFRAEFLSIKEIGEQYTDIFFKNVNNRVYLAGGIFVVTYLVIYISNKFIKHGLKKFFAEENKELPKLPNKTFAMIGGLIAAMVGMMMLHQKYTMFVNMAWFGKSDPIFNTDIGYYIFTLPFMEAVLFFVMAEFVCLIVYTAFYYVIVMNTYLDGVDMEVLKKNTFIKQIIAILTIIALLISIYIFMTSQNILTQDMLKVESQKSFELVGAGKTDVTIKLWGYRIFAVILFLAAVRLLRYAKKANFKQAMLSIAIVPIYLIGLFVCMVYYDQFIVKNEVLDHQKKYIGYHISNTKEAYGIHLEQQSIDNYDTITYNEILGNSDVIQNIPIVSSDITRTTVSEHQEDGVYYSYQRNFLGLLDSRLCYLTPREILSNSSMSYNNRTFHYTHGYSMVINSASSVDENGYAKYILSDFADPNVAKIKEPRIYFGLETNSTIVTNSNFGPEYDYPITATNYRENQYDGKAGLNLGFLDRVILGIWDKNPKLAFSGNVNKNSKIIANRNIIERAKILLPYISYDENPYLVITDEGRLVWVLDGYTTSNEYPYSQRATVKINGNMQEINYIRNSVKVLIDAYDGTTKFYITDRNDPIIMAYRNLYPTLFQDLDEQIPEDISRQFVYPKMLYQVQAEMLSIYHDISEDVLYRADDIWEITPTESATKTAAAGEKMEPYYTMLKTKDMKQAGLGLVVTFNRQAKQNITSYLVGNYEAGSPKLSLYKFSSESNVASILQLSSQIEQDETIAQELTALNVAGTKLIKNIVIVPINHTLLYVQPVYQVRLNESEIPVLKKIIVASGNKLAIGDNLEEAISNLFTDYAVDLEIVDMQDLESVIDAIIRSNTNLEESLNSNNFEMIGKDLSELESLIKRLEELRKAEKKEEEPENENEPSEQTNNIQNDISTNSIDNRLFTN